jgi:hypothetical protein
VLPGTGGITLSHRVGDRCVGLAADHVEPGVSIHSEHRSAGGEKEGANLALNTLACIGNLAVVMSGPCAGARGVVTGKHGGIENVLVDFSDEVLRKLRIGDQVQVYSVGQGARLPDHPRVTVMNASPRLLRRWGLRSEGDKLAVPITHVVPAAVMGSGLGKAYAQRGDYDIQLFDAHMVRRHRLGSLRFGDLVAIANADGQFGRSYHTGHLSIGAVVHSDSTVAGHGPGVVTLVTGPASAFVLMRRADANLAVILAIRVAKVPAAQKTFSQKYKPAQRVNPPDPARMRVRAHTGGKP